MANKSRADLDAAMQKMRETFCGDSLSQIGQGIVPIEYGRAMFHGTTTTILGRRYARRPSGLIVPEAVAAPPAPIDLISTYVTFEDLTGERSSFAAVTDLIKRANLFTLIGFTSGWLARIADFSTGQRDVDNAYVETHFSGSRKIVAQSHLADGRAFVAPQLLHVLAKLAILIGDPEGEEVDIPTLGLLPLALGDHLGAHMRSVEGGERVHNSGLPGVLAREVISNQHFNQPLDPASHLARFTRRWREIPAEHPHPDLGSVEGLYLEATGISFDELELVTLAIFTHACQRHTTLITREFFEKLGIPISRVVKVLELLSTTLPKLRNILVEDYSKSKGLIDWSISPFERFPLVMVRGAVVVLDPKLVLHRTFSWLPYWDIDSGFSRDDKKRRGQFKAYSGQISEIYALEILSSIVPEMGHKRLYLERDLVAAYGRADKVVDAALDYGDSWVVLDVSTSQLTRESVAGVSAEAVRQDLNKLVVKKARQIASTIHNLRCRERILTGRPGVTHRIFYPVIVASEGFPVNPVVTSMIDDMLKEAGLLQEKDVAPLQVIDVAELEIVEALQEEGGPFFSDLLKRKSKAGLFRCSLRDFILVELDLHPRRSRRLERLWKKPFERAMDKLRPVWERGQSRGDSSDSMGEGSPG